MDAPFYTASDLPWIVQHPALTVLIVAVVGLISILTALVVYGRKHGLGTTSFMISAVALVFLMGNTSLAIQATQDSVKDNAEQAAAEAMNASAVTSGPSHDKGVPKSFVFKVEDKAVKCATVKLVEKEAWALACE